MHPIRNGDRGRGVVLDDPLRKPFQLSILAVVFSIHIISLRSVRSRPSVRSLFSLRQYFTLRWGIADELQTLNINSRYLRSRNP